MNDPFPLTRACDAVRIPSGEKVNLPAGTEVGITQALGGTYTIVCDLGMFRIEAADADALGREKPAAPEAPAADGSDLETIIWDRLKTVYDPEIPVNIVDLGLVYEMKTSEIEGGKRVDVKMTLTAPGCGMGPTIQADAKSKVLTVDGIKEAEVELVWDPPWNQNMITEVGKMKLGLI
ncbi:MAG: putative Fe-S cluster assembly protein SufT [Candidatus Methylacidiphilales bacterium]|nr:putative Fe-S cluster assembly protein SufT [Candidatus Methylacidiphilales bacterium]